MANEPNVGRARGPAVMLLAALGVAGCKDAPGLPGAWLDPTGELILVIDRDRTAALASVLGEGSCFTEAQGHAEQTTITLDGTSFPFVQSGNTLTLTDPTHNIDGAYRRVTLDDYCGVPVPEPGASASFVQTLVAGRAVGVTGGKSRPIEFDVPAGTVSFALYVFGADVGSTVTLDSLAGPGTGDLLAEQPSLTECFQAYCSILVPKETSILPVPGHYTAVLRGSGAMSDDDIDIRLALRRGPLASETTFHVHAWVGPTSFPTSSIMSALVGAQSAMATHGITWTIDGVTSLPDTRFSNLLADPLSVRAQAMMEMGDPSAINFFMVDDITGIEGLFGLSSGIPGSLGVAGAWNGVLVNLSLHQTYAGAMSVGALTETMVHESGHLLGLYHTTESPGTVFDILDDTPECYASAYDTNHDGTVLADECASAGGDNVMFWTPSTTTHVPIPQDVLSADQIFVLDHAVIGL